MSEQITSHSEFDLRHQEGVDGALAALEFICDPHNGIVDKGQEIITLPLVREEHGVFEEVPKGRILITPVETGSDRPAIGYEVSIIIVRDIDSSADVTKLANENEVRAEAVITTGYEDEHGEAHISNGNIHMIHNALADYVDFRNAVK